MTKLSSPEKGDIIINTSLETYPDLSTGGRTVAIAIADSINRLDLMKSYISQLRRH